MNSFTPGYNFTNAGRWLRYPSKESNTWTWCRCLGMFIRLRAHPNSHLPLIFVPRDRHQPLSFLNSQTQGTLSTCQHTSTDRISDVLDNTNHVQRLVLSIPNYNSRCRPSFRPYHCGLQHLHDCSCMLRILVHTAWLQFLLFYLHLWSQVEKSAPEASF